MRRAQGEQGPPAATAGSQSPAAKATKLVPARYVINIDQELGGMSADIPRPYDARMISAGDGHWLYVEQVGNPAGTPAVFLHGGPGSGAQHYHRTLFDPGRHRAVLLDQRGSGRSHPYLSLSANTTQHLVQDLEVVREHLGIERWLVTGGSWGSTLAIAYAQAYPQRVLGLVLRAVFLGTDEEMHWAFIDGPRRFRPDLYDDWVGLLAPSERSDPLAAYCARLARPEAAIHQPAAQAWNAYERALSELQPPHSGRLPSSFDGEARLPPTPFVEAHYAKHSFFLQPGELLANAHKLRQIPGVIVQGRYDLLCPPVTAWDLARAWGNCKVVFADNAGHAMTEPGIVEAMRKAVADLTA